MQKTEKCKRSTRGSFSGSPEKFHQVKVLRISTLMQGLNNILDSWSILALENVVQLLSEWRQTQSSEPSLRQASTKMSSNEECFSLQGNCVKVLEEMDKNSYLTKATVDTTATGPGTNRKRDWINALGNRIID